MTIIQMLLGAADPYEHVVSVAGATIDAYGSPDPEPLHAVVSSVTFHDDGRVVESVADASGVTEIATKYWWVGGGTPPPVYIKKTHTSGTVGGTITLSYALLSGSASIEVGTFSPGYTNEAGSASVQLSDAASGGVQLASTAWTLRAWTA